MTRLCTLLSSLRGLGALASGAILLVACAAPVKSPEQAELTAMAESVIAQAVYTDTLLTECGAVSPALKTHAQDLRTIWMDAHGSALAGADTQYNDVLADEVRDYSGHALALSAVRFRHQHEKRAAQELRLNERSANNQRIVCERRLTELEGSLAEPFYIDEESERDLLVRDALLARAEGPVEMQRVPTLALNIARDQAPGRSFRQIERQMDRTCPDAELVVIANEWPHEAYGIYCGQQSQSFLVCDWGECAAP